MKELSSLEPTLHQILLRLLLEDDKSRRTEVLTRLSRQYVHDDLPLALAYLMAFDSGDFAKEIFDDLIKRSRKGERDSTHREQERWRLASCYYFALQCLVYVCSTQLVNKPSIYQLDICFLTLFNCQTDQRELSDICFDNMVNVVQRVQDIIENHEVDLAQSTVRFVICKSPGNYHKVLKCYLLVGH